MQVHLHLPVALASLCDKVYVYEWHDRQRSLHHLYIIMCILCLPETIVNCFDGAH